MTWRDGLASLPRMLRPYDRIGLSAPTRVSHHGYRWYATRSLPRLLRMVALRRARLGLADIAGIVADREPKAGAFRAHLVELRAEPDRLSIVIDALDEQVARPEEAARVVDGRRRHEDERASFAKRLESKFGLGAGVSLRVGPLQQLSDADVAPAMAATRQLMCSFSSLRASGCAPDAHEVRELVARRNEATLRYWSAGLATYRRMGALYETDPFWRGIAAQVDPDLPSWLARSIDAYVDRAGAVLARGGGANMGGGIAADA